MEVKKTLYVTDLDGTLMRNDKSLSRYTVDNLNRMIDEGMMITYATARSFHSAYEITKEIHFPVPVITRNGTVFADQNKKEEVEILKFTAEEIQKLREILKGKIGYFGFVTTYSNGNMMKSFQNGEKSEGMKRYILDHTGDPRNLMLGDEQELFSGMVTYCTLIAEKKELQSLYEEVKAAGSFECVFSKDTYSEDFWLEICPPNATKAKAVLRLKEKYGCGKVVVFGDSVNDLSMFSVADEAYAVENGLEEVKKAAAAVVFSNEEDGVARFLTELWEKEKAANDK